MFSIQENQRLGVGPYCVPRYDAFLACVAKQHEQRLGLGTVIAQDLGRNREAAHEL